MNVCLNCSYVGVQGANWEDCVTTQMSAYLDYMIHFGVWPMSACTWQIWGPLEPTQDHFMFSFPDLLVQGECEGSIVHSALCATAWPGPACLLFTQWCCTPRETPPFSGGSTSPPIWLRSLSHVNTENAINLGVCDFVLLYKIWTKCPHFFSVVWPFLD